MSENAGTDDAFVNQAKDEPFGTTPEESPQAGAPAPGAGDPQGEPEAGGQPALAPPGKPDGEVDTRA